ncbi:MAG: T9SS type A sorting domain-containing protein [Bacteroidia bacterium]|nr:T9SS type A sorting domain-containing protein [Bacteroidia bacterium]
MRALLFGVLLLSISNITLAQTYPLFGTEIPITINGLTFDAMEPAISSNGNILFFNSLNDGITTSLHYAVKVNDSTFTYMGALTGANQTTSPRLDAVASMDSANNFYWVSLRDFPTQFDNFHHGIFNGNNVTTISRVRGDFYIYSSGWLIMDAAINYTGNMLYYCNAYFNPTYNGCGGLPCKARLGAALQINDTTFNKLTNTDAIFYNVNDTNYAVYAPHISKNELELYYTRFFKSNPTQTEICVAVRASVTDTFSFPSIIYASNLAPEGPTLTADNAKLYYHKKNAGLYKIVMRYNNTGTTAINKITKKERNFIVPNPSDAWVHINIPIVNNDYIIEIYSTLGQQLFNTSTTANIDITNFISGIYLLHIKQNNNVWTSKLIKY